MDHSACVPRYTADPASPRILIPMQSLTTTRRYWLPQLIVLGLLAVVATLPFWLTDLDMRVAGHFFHPQADDPWFEAQAPLWNFLYQFAPLLSAMVMIGSLTVLVVGSFNRRFSRVRLYAVFVIAVSVLGPGLLVNEIFKEHWGRPRPHQVAGLEGTMPYLPPLVPGKSAEGKSFPCGHSSVGYAFVAFFLIWLRHRPWLAAAALGLALVLGSLLGAGRIVAGDHFLSDVLWSAVMVYAVALSLYYFILRIPQREDAWAASDAPEFVPPRYPKLTLAGYLLLGAGMLVAVLLATPISQNVVEKIRLTGSGVMPRVLRLTADVAEVTLFPIVADGTVAAEVRIRVRGFGFPGSRVKYSGDTEGGVLTFRVWHDGVFTEKGTQIVLGLVPGAWKRLEVRTGKGSVQVVPGTEQGAVLDLHPDEGLVLRP
jgi:lipid A 4'-phosphatase